MSTSLFHIFNKFNYFIEIKHVRILIKYNKFTSISLSTSLLHLFNKSNYLRIQVNLALKSMGTDKRPNIEHHEKQAVPLAITTV